MKNGEDKMANRARSLLLSSSFLILNSAMAASCASVGGASAKREPLMVPPAPPRVIAPAPEPATETPVSEYEPVPPLPRASRPSRETPRAEPKPASTETTAVPPGPTEAGSQNKPVAPAPGVPAPELRTVETPGDAQATRQVRDAIERALRTLAGIDYRALPQPSQVQYDMAKRFIEQSEEALKARNFTAAQLMAEKAATIAKELSGR
jgi:hypothetical protein